MMHRGTIRSEVDDYLSQEGVLPLLADIQVEFSSWELRDNGTVTIAGITSSLTTAGAETLALFGLPDPYIGPVLGGFIFSEDPVGRDLIGGDGIIDHIEYIAVNPDEQLVSDVGDFLVNQGLLSKGQARVIEVSLRNRGSAAAIPEPSSVMLVLTGTLMTVGARRCRGK